jgi:hypothetical protein
MSRPMRGEVDAAGIPKIRNFRNTIQAESGARIGAQPRAREHGAVIGKADQAGVRVGNA